ncbi:hypothetical protein CLAFUW4_09043 [Fulvia fulva]|uniref:MATE efflux family protein n=1 Tax=Passalora fulva TaxID=5499 RepID=A0A9Q8PH27_PASFU|nr:uncharacterized protein CLAFUR5_09153 [Fulvia fulva]KAK4613442.1 hypothetical protein CLAFUR4_09049 [Fulvia fulva]KAK4614588.1 hypothetical protein CLAFUR0_09041 [Fulvia fulva]UJO22395.1 hypothetical protein CLAFUR5_09153 [Fulvia fulva]WPV20038.1 hypothetical protein CLAFUW4_09043 [Fulvia fulva]WPV35440.1 hypothetical protein CLAFUW7_09044 [Fulvia fulva]
MSLATHPESAAGSEETLSNIKAITFKDETWILLRYSGPLALTYLLQYVYQIVVILVASRLSTDELAGVSLGTTTSNILGYAVFEGMATALDTLCSQAYGAGRMTDVGMHTVRFTIFLHIVAIPIALLWLFAEHILILVKVPSKPLIENAGSFLRFSLIGVPGYASFEAGKRFMQAQGNFAAGFYVLLACLPINIALTWALVVPAGMRVAGAALATSLTNCLRPILLIAYAIFVNRSTLKCWPSTKEIRGYWNHEWKSMIWLAIPGALMTLSEWLQFEILTCTSYLGTAALAAQTFLSTTAVLVWHIPFSASIASSTRIGQLIGAGFTSSMTKLMRWHALVFGLISVLCFGLTIGIMALIQRFLIHDDEVAEIIRITLPFVAILVVFDATQNWPHGVVRGFGWQSIGAWVTFVLGYLYATPLAIYLELGPPHLGIRGLWIGLGSGLLAVTVIETMVILWKLKKTDDLRIEDHTAGNDD